MKQRQIGLLAHGCLLGLFVVLCLLTGSYSSARKLRSTEKDVRVQPTATCKDFIFALLHHLGLARANNTALGGPLFGLIWELTTVTACALINSYVPLMPYNSNDGTPSSPLNLAVQKEMMRTLSREVQGILNQIEKQSRSRHPSRRSGQV